MMSSTVHFCHLNWFEIVLYLLHLVSSSYLLEETVNKTFPIYLFVIITHDLRDLFSWLTDIH